MHLSMRGATDIIRRSAVRFGFAVADIRGPRRTEEVVRARKACALALRRAGYSYPEIGEALRRDHSSVQVSIKHPVHGALVLAERDPEFAEAVAAGESTPAPTRPTGP